MDIKLKGYLFIAITVVTGSLIPILAEAANSVNMYEFFMLTAFVSTAVAIVFIFLTRGSKKLLAVARNPKTLAMSVLIGLLVFLPIEFGIAYAEKFVSASLATVMFRTSPLLMLPLLPTLLREKLTKYQVAALFLAFAGIYIGVTGGTLSSVFVNTNFFVVLSLIAMAFLYALSNVLIKRYMIDMGSLLTISAVTLSLLFSFLFIASGGGSSSISAQTLLTILFLGAGTNFVFYYMYFVGLRILKTTFVTNLASLSPFLTFIFASLFLGEQIKVYYIAIAFLVAAGILIQRLDKVGGTFLAKKGRGARDFVIFDVSGAFADTGEVAIADTLKHGGRVLAIKLPKKHSGAVKGMLAEGTYANVFTHEHKPIANEVDFVRDVTGAGSDDLLLMKAGSYDEGEAFFSDVSNMVDASSKNQFPK